MNLLARFKEKRKEIAEREGKELFMIFHNSTLEETAARRPKTAKDLTGIKGWGKKRIEKYGHEILRIINDEYDSGKEAGQGELLPTRKKTSVTPLSKSPDLKPGLWRESVAEKIFEVGEFIEFINSLVSGLGQLKVKGELNEVDHRQGNAYFQLKDVTGRDFLLRCFMWRWDVEYFNHLLEDGLEVIIQGVPGVYKKGVFNVTVKHIEPVGEGAWKKALEDLKKKLEVKGYFDPARKKPIPEFAKTIGLITSEAGEAINDFRRNIGNFGFQISLFDARVEGDYAESSLIQAIKWFNLNAPETDVIALVRGGGSFESLKAFNSEKLAEAITSSRIPIITGIGHEGDETIADYVADQRCSTPTAVAEFLKNNRRNLILRIENISEELIFSTEEILEHRNFGIRHLNDFLLNSLGRIFERFRKLEFNIIRALHHIQEATQKNLHLLSIMNHTLIRALERKVETAKNLTSNLENSLRPLNPENVLARGYSIVYTESEILKDVMNVRIGDKLHIKLSKGSLKSRVEEVKNS